MFRASAVAGLHSWGPSLMVYWSCAAVSAVYVWSHSKMKPGQGPMGLAKGLVQQSTSSEVASVALAVLHGLSIVPLVLLPIMQDVHLKLGIVLNCTLLLCLMAGSLVFHWMGIVKVCCPSPPPSMPLAYLQHAGRGQHRAMPTTAVLELPNRCVFWACAHTTGAAQDAGHLPAGSVRQYGARGVPADKLASALGQRVPLRHTCSVCMGEWAQSLACCGLRHGSHPGFAVEEHDKATCCCVELFPPTASAPDLA